MKQRSTALPRRHLVVTLLAVAGIALAPQAIRFANERYYCESAWDNEVSGRAAAVEYNRIAATEHRVDRISISTASKAEILDSCLSGQKQHRSGFLNLFHDGGDNLVGSAD